MILVCLFQNDLALTVAMVTEKDRQYRLNRKKCNTGPKFGDLTDVFFLQQLDNSSDKYQKDLLKFYVSCISISNLFNYSCALCKLDC